MSFDERYSVHINLLTREEMVEHAKQMRKEMDSKLESCLMATGQTRAEAMKSVRVWNAEQDW